MRNKWWTNVEDKYLADNYENKTDEELAKDLGRSKNSISCRRSLLFLQREEQNYAMYKGDELLGVGTAKELSELLNCRVKSIYEYASPSRQNNRTRAIKI